MIWSLYARKCVKFGNFTKKHVFEKTFDFERKSVKVYIYIIWKFIYIIIWSLYIYMIWKFITVVSKINFHALQVSRFKDIKPKGNIFLFIIWILSLNCSKVSEQRKLGGLFKSICYAEGSATWWSPKKKNK